MRFRLWMALFSAALALVGCSKPGNEQATALPGKDPVDQSVSQPEAVAPSASSQGSSTAATDPSAPAAATTAPTESPTQQTKESSSEGHSKLFHWGQTKEAALKEAKTNHKYVVLKFEADWCAPCKIMTHEAFQNQELAELMKDAIIVPIDVDTEYGQKLAVEYDTRTIPILHFLRPNGKEFGFVLGYQDVEWLKKKVKKALADL